MYIKYKRLSFRIMILYNFQTPSEGMYIKVTCPCCWQPAPSPGGGKGRTAVHSHYRSGTVLEDSVVVVKAGSRPVRDLLQPVRLTFRYDKKVNVFLALFLDYYSTLLFNFEDEHN